MEHQVKLIPGGSLPVFAGRYGATDVLKAGAGITTYRAVDLDTGSRVIVKATPVAAVPEGTELLLRHEADVLRGIRSSYVAPLLDVGVDDDCLFLVVPLVEGVTLEEHLLDGPLSVRDALAVAEGLLAALAEVFDHGILHRDVKPANIVVNAGSPVARVTLIDFGFSRSDRLDPSLRDLPLGTARYASPEQAGLIGHDVDERSDLYSAGAVMFETLAGRPPFTGERVGEVLRQHVSAPVPSLRALGIRVPRALDELIRRLLAKDPRNRYQTAGAVLVDLRQIGDAVRRGIDDPHVVVGAHDRRCCVLGEPSFVGRRSELEGLDAACHRFRAVHGALVGIEAESGGGKTRLLEEFALRCAQRGAWVLRGQGVDQAAQRPFQTLQGVVDAVVGAAAADAGFAETLRARLGEHRAAACAAMPNLTEVLRPDPEEALGPEAFGPDRSVAALAALIDAVDTPERPAVVLLDDCQWADPLTVKLLHHWRQRHPDDGTHAVVVVAYRSEEVGPGHPLRDTPEDEHMALPPLDDHDVVDLVESMAGELNERAVAVVADLAEGSPFMASAVLHGLVESGALTCAHPGWIVDDDALAGVQSSSRAATFLSRRLELLPHATLALLSAGAVLGKEWDLELASRLAGQETAVAVRARQEARSRHLVWARGQGARCTFVHDKVREALLARLDPAERGALHLAAAERLEETDPTRAFDLAYHFDASGHPDRALPHALAAAAQARARNALEIAEDQYRIASRASEGAGHPVRFEVSAGLGDVTMLLGRYEEAREHFAVALDLAESDLARVEVEGKLAELAFKHGDLEASAAAAERGLRLLRHRVPRSKVGFALAAARQVIVQALHSIFPRLLTGRRGVGRGTGDLLAARLYSRLAHVYWFTLGAAPTLWAHLREMNLAERYAPSRELAQAYSEHAPVMTLVPWIRRGVDYAQRSLAIRRELNDVWGEGQSLNFYGIVLYAAARYDETIETCREAVRLLRRTGDRWELNIARLHLAYALYHEGRLGEAVEVAREIHANGLEIGDVQASGIGAEIWTLAAEGEVPEHLLRVELDRRTRDVQLQVQVMQAEGVRLLAEGRTDDAAEVLDDAARAAARAGIRNQYVAPVRPWLATARRRQAEELSPFSPQRRQAVHRAARSARAARSVARTHRNNRPHALREAGLVAALGGHGRRARRLLARSVELAVTMGQRYEQAVSLAALAAVGEARGWIDAGAVAADAERRLGDIRADLARVQGAAEMQEEAVTLSLVDRFSTLLDQGRAIAKGLSREAVFTAVERAAVELLRAERCVVLGVEGMDRKLGDIESLSSSLIREAMESGRPVIARDETAGDPSDSLVLAGVRSAICAPIFEHGKVTACFYASHRRVADLFGEDEQRLAEFVAAVAGAALENARGFAQVEALRESLEERVGARTRQLTTTLHELERLNQELRDANQAKSDFVSMVSHELRTPLTPIVGLSSTMLQRWQELAPEVVTECIEAIHRQGTRLTRLVDELLELSRIESGTLEAEPRHVDVGAAVAAAVAELAEDPAEVTVRCPAGLTAMADPDRLQQILGNYLENARKYGRPPIEIEASASGSWVELSVIDHGDGVPEEFVDSLFQKFSRAGSVRDVSGTGLGLSIVRGLASAQGGDTWYEPVQPHGARFVVRLPRSHTVGARSDDRRVGTQLPN